MDSLEEIYDCKKEPNRGIYYKTSSNDVHGANLCFYKSEMYENEKTKTNVDLYSCSVSVRREL